MVGKTAADIAMGGNAAMVGDTATGGKTNETTGSTGVAGEAAAVLAGEVTAPLAVKEGG